jgi:tripartite-type tricarboxylate transporter receptor subunit TctC
VVGSTADLLSRIIGQRLGEALGQPVAYENLFLEAGVEEGMKSAPDGYTLIYGSSGNLPLLPHVRKVSFDPTKDLTPVARFVIQPTLIASNPSLPVTTLQELVALIKANPDKIRMSTAGAGTAGRFAGEMFIARAASSPWWFTITAAVRRSRPWSTTIPSGPRRRFRVACRMSAREGSCALAIGDTARLSLLPDVPTVAESGYPGFDAVGWGGIFVPNGTPQPIIDKLAATIARIVTLQDVKAQFAAQGTEPASSTQGETAKMVQDDYARFGALAKRLGVSVK